MNKRPGASKLRVKGVSLYIATKIIDKFLHVKVKNLSEGGFFHYRHVALAYESNILTEFSLLGRNAVSLLMEDVLMNDSEALERHRAEAFFERLEGLLKNYPPSEYAPFVSEIIDECFGDQKLCAKWPLHYLIHSIEANCAYHRRVRQAKIDLKQLVKIRNHYTGFFDPLAKKLLNENEEGFWAFFINMARQQFYLQSTVGRNDIARTYILFGQGGYPRSDKLFQEHFGISFIQWITLCVGIHASVYNHRPAYISKHYFLSAKHEIVPDTTISPFFALISATPDEVKKSYKQTRTKLGNIATLYYETYIPVCFVDKPLLKLEDDKYLVVHKGILLKKSLEGIFDLFKSEGVFGQEFGKVFERYVGSLLSEFIPQNQLFTENDMRRYSDKKVCDFLVNGNDYILLVECKGTEYSSLTASINALQKDNSTKKIATGIIQSHSIARQLNEGIFQELLGDIRGKKIISLIVTFKHIYFTNLKWYWRNVTCFNLDSGLVDEIDKTFSYQPQILSVDELENLLVYTRSENKTFCEVFAEKLGDLDMGTGEWGTYLQSTNQDISLLSHEYETFFDKVLKSAKERISY